MVVRGLVEFVVGFIVVYGFFFFLLGSLFVFDEVFVWLILLGCLCFLILMVFVVFGEIVDVFGWLVGDFYVEMEIYLGENFFDFVE